MVDVSGGYYLILWCEGQPLLADDELQPGTMPLRAEAGIIARCLGHDPTIKDALPDTGTADGAAMTMPQRLDRTGGSISPSTSAGYRPDIDGLRAVAVLSVVLFHAFPASVTGGFTGVDIFFVISGFLISSIIIDELQQGHFSIAGFYARRIVRIFPALALVLAACLAFGWLALLADEYELLGRHVLAGIGFVSNLMFWSESSYFDVAAETKPLLHLWSLGIEEQFYLLWPLALLACGRRRRMLLATTAVIAGLSFAANLYEAGRDPTADFYSPYTRFWELLAGALIACAGRNFRLAPWLANAASCAGLLMIAWGFAFIDGGMVFPGLPALLPVCGVALVIQAGPGAAINHAVLANPLLVRIGLISYPLYLWHWPLLSLARIVESAQPPAWSRAATVLLAFALAWATYRFVEMPFRTGRITRPLAVRLLLGLMLGLAATAWTIVVNDGFAGRRGANPVEKYPNALGRDAYLIHLREHLPRCADARLLELSGKDPVYGYRCFQSQPAGPIDLLLIGDSHAEHLLPGLAEHFPDRNVGSFLQPELPSLGSPHFIEALHLIARNPDIHAVAISAFWFEKIPPGIPSPESQLRKTFALFTAAGKKVYLLDDIPMFPFSPEKCKYGRRFSSSGATCEFPVAEHRQQKEYSSNILKAALKDFDSIEFIDFERFFCDGHDCSMVADGLLLYRDPHHLNIEGSKYLARRLRESGVLNLPR